jgi:hypothetical protein
VIDIKQPRRFFENVVLANGQRALDLDTNNEYLGDGTTPGGLLVEGDFVQGTTAQLENRTFPAGTFVYNTETGQTFQSNGVTLSSTGGGGVANVRVATLNSNVDLGAITNPDANDTDGVTLSDGDLVLVKNQTDQSQNGIYEFKSGALTRHSDYSISEKFAKNSVIVFVREGTQQDQLFHTDNPSGFVLGTDDIVWERYNDFSIPISQVTDLQSELDGKEPVFSKNSAFNKDFGTGSGQVYDAGAVTSALAGKEPTISKNTAFNKNFGTGSGEVAEGNDSRITGALQTSNNLSELAGFEATARSNLGLGSAAESSATDFLQTSNNLSELAGSEATADV